MSNPPSPLNAETDAAALARLRTLPGPETERLLAALETLPTPGAQQDRLIGDHRLALTLPALASWLQAAAAERDERRFRDFLADVRRAAERAEAFRDLLAGAERLHQVNVALLAARLFDALVARDAPAIERLAHTFAEVVDGGGRAGLGDGGCEDGCGMRDQTHNPSQEGEKSLAQSPPSPPSSPRKGGGRGPCKSTQEATTKEV